MKKPIFVDYDNDADYYLEESRYFHHLWSTTVEKLMETKQALIKAEKRVKELESRLEGGDEDSCSKVWQD